MGNEIKMIVEKYCPVIGRNVAVEVSGAKNSACCLHSYICRDESGGCKNKFCEQEDGDH